MHPYPDPYYFYISEAEERNQSNTASELTVVPEKQTPIIPKGIYFKKREFYKVVVNISG